MPITEEQVQSTLSADLSCEQIFRRFEDVGMEDVQVGEYPIAVRGRKPATSV